MCYYTHFTTEERKLSRVLKAQGLSIRAIARMLNRSPSSVSREFRRNSYSNGTYAAHHADKLYLKRRKNCGRKPKLKAGADRDYVRCIIAIMMTFVGGDVIISFHSRSAKMFVGIRL